MAIVDLGDLNKPHILKFKLLDGEVLNFNLRMTGCDGIRALFCQGKNRVALVRTKKGDGAHGQGLRIEQKLIELANDDKGIFSLAN